MTRKIKLYKKLCLYLIALVLVFVTFHFNLFSSFNFITARLDKLNGKLVYPQCEFSGQDLVKLNEVSKSIGFTVVYVDCELFYTNGMESYYRIMNQAFSLKYGDDWLDRLNELNIRTNPNNGL